MNISRFAVLNILMLLVVGSSNVLSSTTSVKADTLCVIWSNVDSERVSSDDPVEVFGAFDRKNFNYFSVRYMLYAQEYFSIDFIGVSGSFLFIPDVEVNAVGSLRQKKYFMLFFSDYKQIKKLESGWSDAGYKNFRFDIIRNEPTSQP